MHSKHKEPSHSQPAKASKPEMKTEKIYNELIDVLARQLVTLPDKPEENPNSTLEALWYFSCEAPRNSRGKYEIPLPELDTASFHKLKKLIKQRIKGTPLAHIIGRQDFMGVDFLISSGALIPRRETEILGYGALSKIKALAQTQPAVKVMDLCTGMGNLALAFAYHEPKSLILAADISEPAIQLAQKNAQHLGLHNQVTFYTGDMLAPFQNNGMANTIDVLTCNPPYISNQKVEKMPNEIIKYEPPEAFQGGPFGLNIIFRLMKEALPFIKRDGWLCFEVGLGQGEGLMKMMEKNDHFNKIESAKDDNEKIRAIFAQIHK